MTRTRLANALNKFVLLYVHEHAGNSKDMHAMPNICFNRPCGGSETSYQKGKTNLAYKIITLACFTPIVQTESGQMHHYPHVSLNCDGREDSL
jgi:hypothetical protein